MPLKRSMEHGNDSINFSLIHTLICDYIGERIGTLSNKKLLAADAGLKTITLDSDVIWKMKGAYVWAPFCFVTPA